MRSLGSAIGTALLPWCLTGCGTEGGPTGPDRAQGPGGEKPPSLTVAPVIGVSPTSLKFLVYAFRPNYDPPAQTLRLKNLGGGVLRWTVSDNGYWLTVGNADSPSPPEVHPHRAQRVPAAGPDRHDHDQRHGRVEQPGKGSGRGAHLVRALRGRGRAAAGLRRALG